MKVLSIDPGLATGMALWDGWSFESWQEEDGLLAANSVWHHCEHTELDEIAMENFHLGTGRAAKTTAGSRITLELMGAIRFIALYFDVPVHFQEPADARSFSTNDKLKTAGFITPANPDHQRSAARHLLLRLVRNGELDARQLLPGQLP